MAATKKKKEKPDRFAQIKRPDFRPINVPVSRDAYNLMVANMTAATALPFLRTPTDKEGAAWKPPFPEDVWDYWINSTPELERIELPPDPSSPTGGYAPTPYAPRPRRALILMPGSSVPSPEEREPNYYYPARLLRLWDFVYNPAHFLDPTTATARNVQFPVYTKRGTTNPPITDHPIVPPYLPDALPVKSWRHPYTFWEYALPTPHDDYLILTRGESLAMRVVFVRAHGERKRDFEGARYEFSPHLQRVAQPVQPDFRVRVGIALSSVPYRTGQVVLRDVTAYTHNGWWQVYRQRVSIGAAYPKFGRYAQLVVRVRRYARNHGVSLEEAIRRVMRRDVQAVETETDTALRSYENARKRVDKVRNLVNNTVGDAPYIPLVNADGTPQYEDTPRVVWVVQAVHLNPAPIYDPRMLVQTFEPEGAGTFSVPPFLSEKTVGLMDTSRNAQSIHWSVARPRNAFSRLEWEPSNVHVATVRADRPGYYSVLCSVSRPPRRASTDSNEFPLVSVYRFEFVRTDVVTLRLPPRELRAALPFPEALQADTEAFGPMPSVPAASQFTYVRRPEWRWTLLRFEEPRLQSEEGAEEVLREQWPHVLREVGERVQSDAFEGLDPRWCYLFASNAAEEYYVLVLVRVPETVCEVARFGEQVELESYARDPHDVSVSWRLPNESVVETRGERLVVNVAVPQDLGLYFAAVSVRGRYVYTVRALVRGPALRPDANDDPIDAPSFTKVVQRYYRNAYGVGLRSNARLFWHVFEYARYCEMLLHDHPDLFERVDVEPPGFGGLLPAYFHPPLFRLYDAARFVVGSPSYVVYDFYRGGWLDLLAASRREVTVRLPPRPMMQERLELASAFFAMSVRRADAESLHETVTRPRENSLLYVRTRYHELMRLLDETALDTSYLQTLERVGEMMAAFETEFADRMRRVNMSVTFRLQREFYFMRRAWLYVMRTDHLTQACERLSELPDALGVLARMHLPAIVSTVTQMRDGFYYSGGATADWKPRLMRRWQRGAGFFNSEVLATGFLLDSLADYSPLKYLRDVRAPRIDDLSFTVSQYYDLERLWTEFVEFALRVDLAPEDAAMIPLSDAVEAKHYGVLSYLIKISAETFRRAFIKNPKKAFLGIMDIGIEESAKGNFEEQQVVNRQFFGTELPKNKVFGRLSVNAKLKNVPAKDLLDLIAKVRRIATTIEEKQWRCWPFLRPREDAELLDELLARLNKPKLCTLSWYFPEIYYYVYFLSDGVLEVYNTADISHVPNIVAQRTFYLIFVKLLELDPFEV